MRFLALLCLLISTHLGSAPSELEAQRWAADFKSEAAQKGWEPLDEQFTGLVGRRIRSLSYVVPGTVRTSGAVVQARVVVQYVDPDTNRIVQSDETRVIDCGRMRYSSLQLSREDRWLRLHRNMAYHRRFCRG